MDDENRLPERTRGYYYGLEEHFESLRAESKLCEKLHASWIVDREKYKKRLETVSQRYPHYSEHNECHSQQIIAGIEFILGESRICQLSASDTWLLLQVAYAHDIGMSISAQELISRMKKDRDFQKKIQEACQETGTWEAYQYIKPLVEIVHQPLTRSQQLDAKQKESYLTQYDAAWPMQLMNAFTTVIESYLRSHHASDSEFLLKSEAIENNFSSRYDPIILLRHRILVARICRLHQAGEKEILELPMQTNGLCHDHMYPRFAAVMLRLGDLLDMDNNRFNQAQLAVSGSNYMTLVHWMKHESVEEFLINPMEISIAANFERSVAEKVILHGKKTFTHPIEDRKSRLCMDACRSMYAWITLLRKELEFLAINWKDIVPRKLEGAAPVFRKPILRIDGVTVGKHEMNLRYEITTKRASEIIEGTGLYSSPQITFLREVIQNAIDATKRQLMIDIRNKRYLELKLPSNLRTLSPDQLLLPLKENISNYRIEFTAEIIELNGKTMHITIRDYGVGITNQSLQGMLKIGESFRLDEVFDEFPPWLRPTSDFGIGLQSVFYLAKEFKIRSRPHIEDGYASTPLREMTFHSTRMGGEIEIRLCPEKASSVEDVLNAEEFGFGTEVVIDFSFGDNDLVSGFFFQNAYKGRESDVFGEGIHDAFDHSFAEVIDVLRLHVMNFYGEENFFPLIIQKTQPPKSKSILLGELFGRFCLHLDSNKINDYSEEDAESDSFSCWSENCQILIRYKKRTVFEHANQVNVYYKGILVSDAIAIQTPINIWFWDADIYLFMEPASAFLEISRERILSERQKHIVQQIQQVHLSCLLYLFQNSEHTGINSSFDLYRWLWTPPTKGSDFLNGYRAAESYYKFVLKQHTDQIPNYDFGVESYLPSRFVKVYDLAEDGFVARCYTMPKSFDEVERYKDIWFVSFHALHDGDVNLKHPSQLTALLVQDVFHEYTSLAAIQFKIIHPAGYHTCIPIYKLASRSSTVVQSPPKEYWTFVIDLFQNALLNEHELQRLVFPSCSEYESVCVSELPDGLATDVIRKFSSYIIAPFTVRELQSKLNCAQDALPHSWVEQNEALCRYIYQHTVKDEDRKKNYETIVQTISKTYEKFMLKFRLEYFNFAG